jgi:poly-gamma-glutamate synthesis protein (capsule biosynthesis protein)
VQSKFLLLFFLSAAFLITPGGKQPAAFSPFPKDDRVCFTGDVMLARGVKREIEKSGKAFLFEKIEPTLEQYKYRFINLECPITPLTHPPDKPFSFRADSNFVSILTSAGITHATLANNHIDDQTIAGATDTYNILRKNGIVGIGLKSKESGACEPAEIIIGNRKIAVFGALGIKMNCSNIWYCEDSVFQRSVETYKKNNPSAYVICYLHWGVEYIKFPSTDQRHDGERLIDMGADMIIGHHPHVIESIQYYKRKPILYSLGNLVFDQHDPDNRRGIIASLTVVDTTVEINVIPYNIEEDRPVPLPRDKMAKFKESLKRISPGVSFDDNGNGWKVSERQPDKSVSAKPDLGMLRKFSPINIRDHSFDGTVSLIKLSGLPGYKLRLTDAKTQATDDLYVPYPIYRFETGDINNDGRTDILLGVIKSTHFDPVVRNRLFFFRIDSSRLSPLWLGSRVCLSLVDFRPVKKRGGNRVMTIEKDQNGLYRNGLYQWDNFGLKLIGYKNENSNESTAYAYFNEK